MRKSTSFLWLFFLILPGILQAESPLFPYRAYTDAHVDIGFRIMEGQLECYWKNESATVDGHPTAEDFSAHEIRALGIFDANTPPLIRPAGYQWDFFGVAAGEPIYILPSGGVPDTLPYLGFSTENTTVGVYDDFRITFVSMVAPEEGVFSLYTGSTISMNSLLVDGNGQLLHDHIEIEGGDHEHYNWAFSQLGTYDLTFRFEILDTSPPLLTYQTIRFQITDGGGYDDYEHWRRTHFTPADILDDTISGPDADAGAAIGQMLGFTNAQRFAFGNNPDVELTWIEIDDVIYPAVELYLRKDTGRLDTFPQTATDLILGNWTADDLIFVDSERIHHDPGLERRIYRLSTPSGPGPRFFRAGAELE